MKLYGSIIISVAAVLVLGTPVRADIPERTPHEPPAHDVEQEAQMRIQELALLTEMKAQFQSYLERGALTLSVEPNPVIPPDDGIQVPLYLEILLGDDRDNLGQVLANWQHVLRLIAGDQVAVSSTFDFSSYSEDVERGDGPYLFRTQSPVAEGYHPLVATVTFTAEGESLAGDFSHLAQTISREVVVPIEVKSVLDITEGPAWDTLQSTTEVSINRSGASSLMGTDIEPSRRMTFRHSRTTQHSHMPAGQQFMREEAEIRIVFARDGESIETLEIDLETYNNESGELTGRMQQRVHNLPGRLTSETEIRAPQAFYRWAQGQSTGQYRHDWVRDGERVWQQWQTMQMRHPSRFDVNFTVSREARQRKWDREWELRQERDVQTDAVREKAAEGQSYPRQD